MLISPLEQFTVSPIKYVFKLFDTFGLPFNTYVLFSFLSTFFIIAVVSISLLRAKYLPSPLQAMFEGVYDFVYSFVTETLGLRGSCFFPVIFFIFTSILAFNLFGLFPYGFALTAQVVTVCFIAFSAFTGILIIGVIKHKLNLFQLFFPAGAPVGLAWLLVPIELVSFFSRPFSLSIRLFANLTAGHVLLKILAGFVLYASFSAMAAFWSIGPVFSSYGCAVKFFFAVGSTNFICYGEIRQIDAFAIIMQVYSLEIAEDFLVYACSTPFINDCENNYCVEEVLQAPVDFHTYLSLVVTAFNKAAQTDYETLKLGAWFDNIVSSFRDIEICLLRMKSQYVVSRYTWLSRAFIELPDFFLTTPVFSHNFQTFGLIIPNVCLFSIDITNLVLLVNHLVASTTLVLFLCLLLTILVIFLILELFVAVLQAYVFSILCTIYIRDVLDLH